MIYKMKNRYVFALKTNCVSCNRWICFYYSSFINFQLGRKWILELEPLSHYRLTMLCTYGKYQWSPHIVCCQCTSPISCHVYVDYGGWSFVSAMIMYDVYQTINSFYTEYCDKMHRMCVEGGGGYPHFCENGVFGIGAFSLKFAKNNVGIPSPKSVCVENPDWVVLLWHKYFILHIHRDAVKHICVSSVWTFLMYRHW